MAIRRVCIAASPDFATSPHKKETCEGDVGLPHHSERVCEIMSQLRNQSGEPAPVRHFPDSFLGSSASFGICFGLQVTLSIFIFPSAIFLPGTSHPGLSALTGLKMSVHESFRDHLPFVPTLLLTLKGSDDQ
jgi:hypothetical protein